MVIEIENQEKKFQKESAQYCQLERRHLAKESLRVRIAFANVQVPGVFSGTCKVSVQWFEEEIAPVKLH